MRPLLKWAGGKARLAPEIHKAFNQSCSGTYLEPFTGSGAVFLYMRAQGLVRRAVLSDANPKLMAVHIAVRDRVEEVLAALGRLPSEDWRERYYDVRDAYNRGPWDGPEHAARFIWLNRAGFNGLYRENRAGEFNVPLGRYARLSLPAPEHFRAVSGLFAGVEMVTCDFGELMSKARAGDHVYCDPPTSRSPRPRASPATARNPSDTRNNADSQTPPAWPAPEARGSCSRTTISRSCATSCTVRPTDSPTWRVRA